MTSEEALLLIMPGNQSRRQPSAFGLGLATSPTPWLSLGGLTQLLPARMSGQKESVVGNLRVLVAWDRIRMMLGVP